MRRHSCRRAPCLRCRAGAPAVAAALPGLRRRPRTGWGRRSSSATCRAVAIPPSAMSRSTRGRTRIGDAGWRSSSARQARPGTACSCSTRPAACCACSTRPPRSTPGSPGGRTPATWPFCGRRPMTRRKGRTTACSPGPALERANGRTPTIPPRTRRFPPACGPSPSAASPGRTTDAPCSSASRGGTTSCHPRAAATGAEPPAPTKPPRLTSGTRTTSS